MRIVAKISYESLYAFWKVFSKVLDLIYAVICTIDRWLSENEK